MTGNESSIIIPRVTVTRLVAPRNSEPGQEKPSSRAIETLAHSALLRATITWLGGPTRRGARVQPLMADGGAGPACGAAAGWMGSTSVPREGVEGWRGEGVRPREIARPQSGDEATGGKDWAPPCRRGTRNANLLAYAGPVARQLLAIIAREEDRRHGNRNGDDIPDACARGNVELVYS